MENHIKDEQIQRQSETIASLERKVESLEKELHRCLDPDSGELMPKTDDTDESNSVFFAMTSKAEAMLRGVFGETDDDRKSFSNWIRFRNFLLTDDSIDALRMDKDFKWGTLLVTRIIKFGDDLLEETGLDETHELYGDIAKLFIGEICLGDNADHKAILKLIEAFQYLKLNTDEYDMETYDVVDLELDLEIIERCQRIAARSAKFRK